MKISKDGRILTGKEERHDCMLRVGKPLLELWISAASKRGVSRAAFMREALREMAVRTLSETGENK